MKKILLSVLITLCSLISISQPVFQKAYDGSFGIRQDANSPVEWYEKNKTLDILICFEDDKITIFSKETQVYRLLKQVDEDKNGVTWLMVDEKGLKCNVKSGLHQETQLLYLKIEYSDAVILYFTKPN